MTRHYFIAGMVQGVGFRHFVRAQARKMNVRGWVRNTREGGVEATATAETDVLAIFEERLRRGPELSRVDSLEASDLPEEDFEEFEVRF